MEKQTRKRKQDKPLPQSHLLAIIEGYLLSNAHSANVERVEGLVGGAVRTILNLQQTNY